MSSKEIQKKFIEKKHIVWKQMLEQDNSKGADMVSKMCDLFLDYGAQMFKDGLDKGEEIYNK